MAIAAKIYYCDSIDLAEIANAKILAEIANAILLTLQATIAILLQE